MIAVNFEGAVTYSKPHDMTDEQCASMYVMQGVDADGTPFALSHWMPNKEDIEAINAGRGIWLKVCTPFVPLLRWLLLTKKAKQINQYARFIETIYRL